MFNLNSRMIIIIISFLFIFAFIACTLQGGKGIIRLLSQEWRKVYKEEFIENSPGLEESDFLNVTKEGIKIDKLYEMNTIIGEGDLESEEAMEAKTKYLNTLIKEAEIGVQEEYFDLVPKDYEVDKLKVKN